MATYKHIRSNVYSKRPTTSLADGQIAINTNVASPGVFFKDSAGTGIVKVGPVHVGTTAPNSTPGVGGSTGNSKGEQWLDTSLTPAQLKVWNGSAWVGVVADELPVSKLQNGSAYQLLQTDAAGTGVEWASNIDVPGSLNVTSTAVFDSTVSHPLGSAAAPTITFTGDANTGIYSPGIDQVAITTGGTGRLFVDASGRVGIGTASSPSNALEINNSDPTIRLTETGGGYAIVSGNTGNIYIAADAGNTTASSNIQLAIDGTTRLRISSNGSAEFASDVKVSGNIEAHSGGATRTVTLGPANAGIEYNVNGVTFLSGRSDAYDLSFRTNSVERARITSSGSVGIGTSSPATILDINKNGAVDYSTRATLESTSHIVLRNNNANSAIVWPGTTTNSNKYVSWDHFGGTQAFRVGSVSNSNVRTEVFSISISGTAIFNRPAGESARIDSSGNVGIGTSSPSCILDVQGGAGSTIKNLNAQWVGSGTNSTFRTDGVFDFQNTSGTARLRIDSSGRLLVGTSSPHNVGGTFGSAQISGSGTQTHFVSTSTSPAYLNLAAGSNGTNLANGNVIGRIQFFGYHTNGYDRGASIEAAVDGTPGDGDMPGRLVFYTTADGASSPTERLRIGSSGNVFIGGTTAASADIALNANGSATFAGKLSTGGANSVNQFSVNSTNANTVVADFTGTQTYTWLQLNASGTTGSNVRVGVNANDLYLKAANTNAVLTSSGSFILGGTLPSSPNIDLNGSDGSAEFAGTVSAQGTVLTSDQRFKENITDANAQLADVTALGNSLRNWDWTADAPVADKDTRFLGLVAQEAEAICPGIVATIVRTKDGDELTPEVVVPAVYETRTVPAVLDEEGEVVEAETTEEVLITEEQVTPATYEQLDDSYKGIKNDILIMKLLGAVAELSAKVAALEAG